MSRVRVENRAVYVTPKGFAYVLPEQAYRAAAEEYVYCAPLDRPSRLRFFARVKARPRTPRCASYEGGVVARLARYLRWLDGGSRETE